VIARGVSVVVWFCVRARGGGWAHGVGVCGYEGAVHGWRECLRVRGGVGRGV
jgi:hypothetical protein